MLLVFQQILVVFIDFMKTHSQEKMIELMFLYHIQITGGLILNFNDVSL